MEAVTWMVQSADKVLNLCFGVVIVLALLFGGYSLWDTYRIYAGAGVDGDLLKYRPGGDASNLSLSELIALNGDVRAWLTVDGTGIDYPVLQGATNMDYLNTDVFGNYALSGSIFMDCGNAGDFSDFYTLLYGHHMDGGVMFGDLTKFREAAFLDEHATGTLFAPDATYRLELYACLSVDAYDARVFDPAAQDAAMLDYIQENALAYRDIGVSADDKIIGLSTCSDATTNGRTVVYARMIETTK